MKCLALILLLLFVFTSDVEARKRLDTYVDAHGVRRVCKTGKIYRDYKAIREFKRMHPRPEDGHTYDIDHIVPLSRGGRDVPSNMRWVRVENHRKKTARERKR